MRPTLTPHRRALLQALFVTFLWSTSWLFIKVGLAEIPSLTFAGLRYSLAFLLLLPLGLRAPQRAALRALSRRGWAQLLLLGLLYYAITQGAQFIGLLYLPSVTVSLLYNFTIILVALLGAALLAERPSGMQWAGVALSVAGALLYFYPVSLPASALAALLVVLVGVVANALSAILGRYLNRAGTLPPLAVTLVSMGVGSLLLLATGLAVQGLPRLSLKAWAIVGWLALVNTAFAFTLWNRTLRTLSAVESSVINSTMLIQIALLAWLFLGERLTPKEVAGLVLTGSGVLLVQLRGMPRRWRLRRGLVQGGEGEA